MGTRPGVVVDIETILRPERLAAVLLSVVPVFGPLILPYWNSVFTLYLGEHDGENKPPPISSLCWDEWVEDTWLGKRPADIKIGDLASTSALWLSAKERGFVCPISEDFYSGGLALLQETLKKWFIPEFHSTSEFDAFDYLEPYKKVLIGEDILQAYAQGKPVRVGFGHPMRLVEALGVSIARGGNSPLPLFISCRRHRGHLRRIQSIRILPNSMKISIGFSIGRFQHAMVRRHIEDGNIERLLDSVQEMVEKPELVDKFIHAAIDSVQPKLLKRLGVSLGVGAVGTYLGAILAGPLGGVAGGILSSIAGDFGFTWIVGRIEKALETE